jgi:hypothetical protein
MSISGTKQANNWKSLQVEIYGPQLVDTHKMKTEGEIVSSESNVPTEDASEAMAGFLLLVDMQH